MIVEYVQFKYPAGWTREQILDDAAPTIRDGRPTRS